MDINTNINYTSDKSEGSMVNLTVNVTFELFDFARKEVLKSEAANITIEGFRKGTAPMNLIENKLGVQLLEKTVESLIPQITSFIISKDKLYPLNQIQYSIKSMSPIKNESNPALTYEAKFITIPEVKLPDLSDLGVVRAEIAEVTDTEANDYLEKVNTASKESEEKMTLEQAKERLNMQRKADNEQQFKTDIIQALITKSELDFPESLVAQQASNSETQFREQLKSLGLDVDTYLNAQKANIEQLRETWTKQARDNMKVELCLSQYIRDNKITVSDDEINTELKNIPETEIDTEEKRLKYREYIHAVRIQQIALDDIAKKIESSKK